MVPPATRSYTGGGGAKGEYSKKLKEWRNMKRKTYRVPLPGAKVFLRAASVAVVETPPPASAPFDTPTSHSLSLPPSGHLAILHSGKPGIAHPR
jgi:hypothetical protein